LQEENNMAYTVATHESQLAATRDEPNFEVGGSLMEASGGAAAIVLSILGLLHISATLMASIATIVIGTSLLVAGGTLAARFSKLPRSRAHRAEMVGGGMAMESLGGAAGIVLGILSLVGAGSTTLLPVAAIVFGGSLLVANGIASRLDAALTSERQAISEVLDFATGPTVLIALSGIVLGILALASISPILLSLAAMLSFGVAVLLSGAWLASTMMKLFSA
jgi:hypothetical protein